MKKLLRSVLLGVLIGLAAVLMSGCDLLKPVEDLYALPALLEEYSQLQSSIQKVMDELQAEYAVISYGSNTSTIQLLDMDNDGVQETAAVFLRVGSAEEKPLRVCLFQRDRNDTYKLAHTVQGDGMSIYSVSYEDLTGDGVRELIVSWQMTSKINTLSAYQISAAGTAELMNTSYNERCMTVDMDNDGCREIVVFQQSSSEDESNRAEYYRYQDGAMIMSSVAPLSASIRDVTATQSGKLADGVTSIYVTGEVEGGVLTDILVLDENGLRNVTMDTEMGVSQTTVRSYTDVSATDINGDGIVEIPLPVPLSNQDPESTSVYYVIYWRQFDSNGASAFVSATYHSVTDGWYLELPRSWLGKITVARDDSRSVRGERAVVFYYWPDEETTTPAAFLTVYRLTGDNRYSRSKLSGRVTLRSDSSAIYCASLSTDVWDCGIEASELTSLFRLITVEWSSQ